MNEHHLPTPNAGRGRASTKRHGLVLWLALLLSPVALPQEGHPLVGTWFGTWGEDDTLIILILNWDGQQLHGTVNPGPDSSTLTSGQLDSSEWRVELEMPVTDGTGASSPFTINGQLRNIGSRTRTLTGSYRYNGETGTITLTRQSGA